MSRLICVWFPDWPLQCWAVERRQLDLASPELTQLQLLLQCRDARQVLRVAACSEAARRGGVREGMSIVEARHLLDRCLVADYDPIGNQEALERFAEWCEQFSPLVGWQETASHSASHSASARGRRDGSQGIDTLFLDVTQVAALSGGELELGRKILQGLSAQGYQARMAIADTLGAAWGVARYAPRVSTTAAWVRWTVGGSASGGSASGGSASGGSASGGSASGGSASGGSAGGGSAGWLIPAGECRAELARLPVAALRLPAAALSRLEQLGVSTIEELERLPRSSLAARVGSAVPRRLAEFWGAVPERMEVHRRAPEFQVEWCLEYPVSDRQALEAILRQLIERLVQLLQQHGRGVLQLYCWLDQIRLAVGLYEPSACPRHLWDLLRMPWERLRLSGPVSRMVLQGPLTVRITSRQESLFAVEAQRMTREWTVLVERLSSRMGKEQVALAVSQADADPQHAFRYVPWLDRHGRKAAQAKPSQAKPPQAKSPQAKSLQPADRPCMLWESPQLLQMQLSPQGVPFRFQFLKKSFEVAECWGPERIETGWWRDRKVARDYYQVETSSGGRFWIYRRHADGAWFLHGEF